MYIFYLHSVAPHYSKKTYTSNCRRSHKKIIQASNQKNILLNPTLKTVMRKYLFMCIRYSLKSGNASRSPYHHHHNEHTQRGLLKWLWGSLRIVHYLQLNFTHYGHCINFTLCMVCSDSHCSLFWNDASDLTLAQTK